MRFWLFLRREDLRFMQTLFHLGHADADIARVDAGAAVNSRSTSILDAWSLSTRRGSSPAWPHCAVRAKGGRGYADSRRMVVGRTPSFLSALRYDASRHLPVRRSNQRRMLPCPCWRPLARSFSRATS